MKRKNGMRIMLLVNIIILLMLASSASASLDNPRKFPSLNLPSLFDRFQHDHNPWPVMKPLEIRPIQSTLLNNNNNFDRVSSGRSSSQSAIKGANQPPNVPVSSGLTPTIGAEDISNTSEVTTNVSIQISSEQTNETTCPCQHQVNTMVNNSNNLRNESFISQSAIETANQPPAMGIFSGLTPTTDADNISNASALEANASTPIASEQNATRCCIRTSLGSSHIKADSDTIQTPIQIQMQNNSTALVATGAGDKEATIHLVNLLIISLSRGGDIVR